MTAEGGCPTSGKLHESEKLYATESGFVQIICANSLVKFRQAKA